MVLIAILVLTLLILGVVSVLIISTVGAGAIVLFGDVIVCGLFIWWLIKRLIKKRRR